MARLVVVLLVVLLGLGLTSTAQADDAPTPTPSPTPSTTPTPTPTPTPTTTPVEPYAGYQPQTTCSPTDKPGTKVLSRWIVATYGGRWGNISRACTGGSVSEHKEGRAFDWMLNAASATDRARAARFIKDLLATGPSGEPAELARRMGVMYLIWNDRMYASYDRFRAKAYRNAACRTLSGCSKTLRHRDHLHLSLTRAGGAGTTSWYVARAAAK